MRKTLTTVALLLALSCTVFGGEMSTPPAPTPPQPASAIQELTITGEIHIPPSVLETLTQTALEVLAVLPSLL